ncbi:hypothetical protein [Stieleria varia]|uniref:hypothetical protein n=1 Tax=Stieleria varia TaxID=2528005 RepID=UPI0011B5DCE5|nr:hypothetical protein [Stieleria varia]
MISPLDHPWITEPEFHPVHQDLIRVAMKSALAMLESEDPPAWIVTLDESGMWYGAHTRVVIDEYTTMDVEGNPVDAPVSTLLSDQQSDSLLYVLNGLTPQLITDVENFVLDGTWCLVAVMNGATRWCAFSQFCFQGMDSAKLALPGPRIANLLKSFYRGIANPN